MYFLKEYGWAGATGAALSMAGWDISTWQFWVSAITISLLFLWREA